MVISDEYVAYAFSPTKRAYTETILGMFGWYMDIDGSMWRSDRVAVGDTVVFQSSWDEAFYGKAMCVNYIERTITDGWGKAWPMYRCKHRGEWVDKHPSSAEKEARYIKIIEILLEQQHGTNAREKSKR